MTKYLQETEILNFSDDSIQKIVTNRNWRSLDTISCVKAIYNYVRDEIKFGYNFSDDITASEVL